MLKVLIVDDTQEKIVEIRKVLEGFVVAPEDVPITLCIREALKECSKTRFDLVILDLYIPFNAGDDPSPENAKTFLKLIKDDPDIVCPIFVIGITRKHDIGEYESLFVAETLQVLWYADNDDEWKEQLKNRLDYLSGVKKKMGITYEYDYDVAIINALQSPEHEVMKRTIAENWKEINLEDDTATTYYETILQGKDGNAVRCIACYAQQMGSIASATLTTKVLLRFHPRYLFMTGICAAMKGYDVGFGDIMVATQVWDGMSGKYKDIIKEDSGLEMVFEPDYRQISLNPAMLNIITRLRENAEVTAMIKDRYDGFKPETELKIHVGPMTSVPAVIGSDKSISELKAHARKLIGLEMESYGLFYSAEHAHFLKPIYTTSIKSASDLADKNKTDEYQQYASYTSAAFVKYLIEKELSYK